MRILYKATAIFDTYSKPNSFGIDWFWYLWIRQVSDHMLTPWMTRFTISQKVTTFHDLFTQNLWHIYTILPPVQAMYGNECIACQTNILRTLTIKFTSDTVVHKWMLKRKAEMGGKFYLCELLDTSNPRYTLKYGRRLSWKAIEYNSENSQKDCTTKHNGPNRYLRHCRHN